MTDQDPELRELLAIAREGMSPTADDTARVSAGLSSRLAPEAGPRAPSPSAGGRALLGTRLRWLALGLGAGGLAGYALGQFHSGALAPAEHVSPSAPERALAAAAPALEQPPATALPEAPSAALPARADAGRAERAPKRELHEPEPRGADEVALMQRVNRALARGEAAWALSLLKQLDLELPQGRLLEERAAGSAIARCMLDPRVGEAELARYTRRYPQSVHLPRVSQVCTAQAPGMDP